MKSYGFIITRHVNSETTNKYWNNCVKLLKTLYPFRSIVIIDDNSIQHFVKPDFEYKNITIINSEFKGRGELLPYYYYLKNKFFENAIIIHDSVFFHRKIEFDLLKGVSVLPLWFFYADKENVDNTMRISSVLTNRHEVQNKISNNIIVLGLKHLKWYGCFGCQSYINHNFLLSIENKYHISNMIHIVHNRKDRCCLERIFGAIFFTEYQKIINRKSLFGDIMKYGTWGYSYNDYQNDIQKGKIPKSIIKIWTGR
jgi:hypothetical protein